MLKKTVFLFQQLPISKLGLLIISSYIHSKANSQVGFFYLSKAHMAEHMESTRRGLTLRAPCCTEFVYII